MVCGPSSLKSSSDWSDDSGESSGVESGNVRVREEGPEVLTAQEGGPDELMAREGRPEVVAREGAPEVLAEAMAGLRDSWPDSVGGGESGSSPRPLGADLIDGRDCGSAAAATAAIRGAALAEAADLIDGRDCGSAAAATAAKGGAAAGPACEFLEVLEALDLAPEEALEDGGNSPPPPSELGKEPE